MDIKSSNYLKSCVITYQLYSLSNNVITYHWYYTIRRTVAQYCYDKLK